MGVFGAIKILSITANVVAFIAGLFMAIMLLRKSIQTKKAGVETTQEFIDSQVKIFEGLKMCARCGFFFQLLDWVLFAAKGSYSGLSATTFAIAVCWGVLCVFTILAGLAEHIINSKCRTGVLMRKKVTWFFLYTVLYFVVTFFIG